MAGAYVTVTGAEAVEEYLRNIGEGAASAGHEVVLVGSNLRYAFGIETGRHRGGRLARRAGGAHYLRGGYEAVRPQVADAIADALPHGAAAVLRAMLKLGHDLQRESQERVPVKTGALRRSLHTVVGR